MRKLIYALMAGALLVLGASAAHADYNTVSGSVQAGSSVTPGATETCTSSGWKIGSKVDCTMHSDPIFLCSSTADSTGTASCTYTVPSNVPPGTHTITAQGIDPSGNARVITSGSFTVLPATAVLGATQNRTSGSALTRTGLNHTLPLTVGGVALVIVGAGLFTVARRRRSTVPATA